MIVDYVSVKVMTRTILLYLLYGILLINCSPQKSLPAADVKEIPAGEAIEATDEYNGLVFFKGVGNEPFWSIEITDSDFRFKSLTEDLRSFIAPYVEPVKKDETGTFYEAKTKSGDFRLAIKNIRCVDTMSGEKKEFTVSIAIKTNASSEYKQFEGCGSFLTDYRLHDIWVLSSLGDKEVSLADFTKELPYLEINASENSFIGYAGCNRMGGKIVSHFDQISFREMVSTKMACLHLNQETEFLETLQTVTQFKIENNRLYLFTHDKPALTFKKVD